MIIINRFLFPHHSIEQINSKTTNRIFSQIISSLKNKVIFCIPNKKIKFADFHHSQCPLQLHIVFPYIISLLLMQMHLSNSGHDI